MFCNLSIVEETEKLSSHFDKESQKILTRHEKSSNSFAGIFSGPIIGPEGKC